MQCFVFVKRNSNLRVDLLVVVADGDRMPIGSPKLPINGYSTCFARMSEPCCGKGNGQDFIR